MQIFNVGPLELIFILVIMILVLGPKGMVKGAREFGKFIRKVTRSPLWRDVVDTSNEIRDLPNKIMREAGIEKEIEELRRGTRNAFSLDHTENRNKEDSTPPSTTKKEKNPAESKARQYAREKSKTKPPEKLSAEQLTIKKKPTRKAKS